MKQTIQSLFGALGYVVVRKGTFTDPIHFYEQDGIQSGHNHAFVDDPAFQAAYNRGLQASEGIDPRHHWRVHIALWSARLATAVEGDYVECGVNAGFMSSAIMCALRWNEPAHADRSFYLVDSFAGPRMSQFTADEEASGFVGKIADAVDRGAYVTDVERIRENFSEWPSAIVVQGFVPEALETFTTERVAFLHLDMNAAVPEKQALLHFWPLMPKGAVVLMDDYAYIGCDAQKVAIDEACIELGCDPLSLPTGQGLIIKT